MLDQAFDALKTFDWGADLNTLNPIGQAILATQADAAARKDLEARLAAVLKAEAPRDAKDYVCRKLMQIGTASSVPALAELLPNKDLSHMARYALERMEAPAAGQALREALPTVSGVQKVGVISSLGVRCDNESVPALAALLADADGQVARAAVLALGNIRTPEAAKALAEAKPAEVAQAATIDARLVCAEALLSDGKKAEALAIYKAYAGENQPKQVRLAAVRGMLACAGKKE